MEAGETGGEGERKAEKNHGCELRREKKIRQRRLGRKRKSEGLEEIGEKRKGLEEIGKKQKAWEK